ncbi:MAG: hypothetical protein ACK4TA_10055 [Saprospiraceae bacterium]
MVVQEYMAGAQTFEIALPSLDAGYRRGNVGFPDSNYSIVLWEFSPSR